MNGMLELKMQMLLRNQWYLKDKLALVRWEKNFELAKDIEEELIRMDTKMAEYKQRAAL